MKRLINLDRKVFYALCRRFKLHPYEAACWAWLKGLIIGIVVGAILL